MVPLFYCLHYLCIGSNLLQLKRYFRLTPSRVTFLLKRYRWLSRFQIQGSRAQNHWVAPRLTQPFILSRSKKWVLGTSGNLVVKSKVDEHSCTALWYQNLQQFRLPSEFFWNISKYSYLQKFNKTMNEDSKLNRDPKH